MPPGRLAGMAARLYHLAVDAHGLPLLARFWCAVLDWKVLFEDAEEIVIGADESAWPGMCFLPVPEGKTVKNRLHIDLAPDDRDAEVERLIGLGARRADVGQDPGVTWAVLADPEGNEFCALSPKNSLVDRPGPRQGLRRVHHCPAPYGGGYGGGYGPPCRGTPAASARTGPRSSVRIRRST